MKERLAPDAIRIRPAEGAERRACRMLLQTGPEGVGQVDALLLAITTDPAPRMLGALSLLSLRDAAGGAALLVSGRVVGPWRRRGVGSLLLETAINEARQRGARSLMVQNDPRADPDGDAFLAAKGFRRSEELRTFEASTARLAAHICALRDRLRGANRIPPEARVVPLRDAPLAQVARLHAEHLTGTPQTVAERLNELLVRDDRGHHGALMLGERLLGLVLARTVDGVSTVESRVLAPTGRAAAGGGWASVLPLAEGLDAALARGSRVVRFSCNSGNQQTLRLAERCGATVVGEQWVHRLEVPAAGAPAVPSTPTPAES